jgi:multidrug efflux pump subunit AcrA (membrane-fusion protein)
VTAYLIGFSAEVEKPEEEKNLRLVETIPLRYSPHTMKVQGQGFIEPSHSLELASQAGGQVIESYQNLKSGIAVEKGTLLIQLDDELIINRLALSGAGKTTGQFLWSSGRLLSGQRTGRHTFGLHHLCTLFRTYLRRRD